MYQTGWTSKELPIDACLLMLTINKKDVQAQ